MEELNNMLNKFLFVAEFIAALVGVIYFYRLHRSYWKWFSVYLVIICLQELFWYNKQSFLGITVSQYYAFFGIPVQFIFFYWLYALKSLKKPKLFVFCLLAYMLPLLFKLYYEETDYVYTFNANLGTAILVILVILELIKQINNDNILLFRSNKMFYINVGLILFYLGAYPIHAYNNELYEQYRFIWNGYYLYFLVANCIMYLLFAASFIWGKEK